MKHRSGNKQLGALCLAAGLEAARATLAPLGEGASMSHLASRLPLLGLAALMLGGCMYFTPPTGLRIGDRSQEFAHLQQSQGPATGEVRFLGYEASDFAVVYPEFWSVGRTDVPAGEGALMRVGIGAVAETGEAEGMVVTTIAQPSQAGSTDANEQLIAGVKNSLGKSYTGFSVVSEGQKPLGGRPGYRLEAKGKDGRGLETHLLAQTAVHGGQGYVVVLSTTESRFSAFLPLFELLYERFTFKEPGASPAPSATPQN